MDCCANHNRLDRVRHIDHYQHPMCGTPDPWTRKADYCCFTCPVLHGTEPKPDLSTIENARPHRDDSRQP
jgi:hypothetical protein